MDAFCKTLLQRWKKLCCMSVFVLAILACGYLYMMFVATNSQKSSPVVSKITIRRLETPSLKDGNITLEPESFNSIEKSPSESTRRLEPNQETQSEDVKTGSIDSSKVTIEIPQRAVNVHHSSLFKYRAGTRINSTYDGAIVPLPYRRNYAAFEKYKNYLAEKEAELPLQTKVIVILTNHRSGSSFFGELFNQHPDVFYSFEPLIGLTSGTKCKNEQEQISIVGDMARCVIPDYQKIYKNIGITQREILKTRNLYICAFKQYCFASFTKEVCDERHCPKPVSLYKRDTDCSKTCGKVNINLLQNDCRKKKMMAMKLIRFCDINKLEFLVKELQLDLKVLHLIRDPRGIASSRRQLKRSLNVRESLNFTCFKQARNIETGLFNTPDWLKGRYKFVRYEDTALYPYQVAQDVYDFVGLNMTKNMYEWIERNTAQPPPDLTNNSQTSETDISNDIIYRIRKIQRNPWGHARVSSTIVQKWRRFLPYQLVDLIQSVCGDIMNIAGYLPVKNSNEYNMKEANFLRALPPYF